MPILSIYFYAKRRFCFGWYASGKVAVIKSKTPTILPMHKSQLRLAPHSRPFDWAEQRYWYQASSVWPSEWFVKILVIDWQAMDIRWQKTSVASWKLEFAYCAHAGGTTVQTRSQAWPQSGKIAAKITSCRACFVHVDNDAAQRSNHNRSSRW